MSRKKQQPPPVVIVSSYDRRLTTNQDRWCRLIGKDPVAPFGYIISLPFPTSFIELRNLGGHIIRARKCRGKLLLQVVKPSRTDLTYTIRYQSMEIDTKASGKMRRVIRHCINIESPLPRKAWRKNNQRHGQEDD